MNPRIWKTAVRKSHPVYLHVFKRQCHTVRIQFTLKLSNKEVPWLLKMLPQSIRYLGENLIKYVPDLKEKLKNDAESHQRKPKYIQYF